MENYQTVHTNSHSDGGEMAKQKQYPEIYLGDPEIDFAMLAIEVREPQALEAAPRRPIMGGM